MALILQCGESMEVGEPKWDETGRFELVLQPDGNLVIYAYALQPQPHRFATGATNTEVLGADVQLHLQDNGQLVIRQKSKPEHIYWKVPTQFGHHDDRPPRWFPEDRAPQPGSSLHLHAGGNLCLYLPEITPGNITWSMGRLLQDIDPPNDPAAPKIVNPQSLALPIKDGLIATGEAATVIRNESSQTLEVYTATQRPVQVRPNAFVGVVSTGEATPIGSLALPVFLNAPGNSSNAEKPPISLPPIPLRPGEVVFIRNSRSAGVEWA